MRNPDENRLTYWRAVLGRRGCTELTHELVAGESVGFRVVRGGQHYDYRYRPDETAEALLERIATEMEEG